MGFITEIDFLFPLMFSKIATLVIKIIYLPVQLVYSATNK